MPEYEQVLKFLGEIVAYGGGTTAIAFIIFRFLGKSWIENKFSQRLEQYKHFQALEIQRLRVEIDSMLSGALKIQEREFTLLPEAWAMLDEAHGRVSNLVSPFQMVADVGRMTDIELDHFLSTKPYAEYQKNQIKNSHANQRSELYNQIEFWYKLHEVKQSISNFHNYIVRNSIFFPDDLNENILEISNLLWSAVIDKEVGREAHDHKMQNEGWKRVQDEIEPLYKEIQQSIRNRLQSHSKKR